MASQAVTLIVHFFSWQLRFLSDALKVAASKIGCIAWLPCSVYRQPCLFQKSMLLEALP